MVQVVGGVLGGGVGRRSEVRECVMGLVVVLFGDRKSMRVQLSVTLITCI